MRKIKRARITTISLCQSPKNGFRTLLKADGAFELQAISKAGKGNELLAVVYAPERPDSDGDFADASVIKAMAHEYNRDHRTLDIEHDGHALSKDEAYLAESFIVAKGDERFQDWKGHDGKPVGDLTGAWGVVIKLEDLSLQKALRDGELDGVSMFGKAALEQLDTKAASKRVAERISAAHLNHEEEFEMDETKLKGMFAEFAETLTKALTPKTPEKAPAAPVIEAPVFKGDPTKVKDLEAFQRDLQGYELRKGMADGTLTAAKIAEMIAELNEVTPSDKEAKIEKGDNAEVRDLKRQVFKAKKRSNSPEGGTPKDDDDPEEILKANREEGKKLGNILAERRGFQVVQKSA